MKLKRRISWLLTLVMLLGVLAVPGTAVYAETNPRMEISYEADDGTTMTPDSKDQIFWMSMKLYGVDTLAALAIKIKYDPAAVQIVDEEGTPAKNMTMGSKGLISDSAEGIYYDDSKNSGFKGIAFDSTGPKVKNDTGLFALYHSTVVGGGPFYEYPLTAEEKAKGLPVGKIRFKVIDDTKSPNFKFDYKEQSKDGGYYQDVVKGGTEYKAESTFPVTFAPAGFGPQAPKAPTVTAAVQGKDRITVSWTPNGAEADYYEVTGNGETTTQAGVTKTFTNLTKGTEYTFSVKGHNDLGDGPAGTAKAKTWSEPGAPASVTGGMASEENALRFVWTAPADIGGTPITGYQLTVTEEGGQTVGSPEELGAGVMEKTVTGLTEGKKYKASVKAKNDVDYGAAKESALVEVVNAVGAAAPVFNTDLTTAAISKEYGDTLTLTVAADAADPAAEAAKGTYTISYQWYEAKDASGARAEVIEGATAATYTTKVSAGTRYFYCTANNHNGLELVTGKKGETDVKTQSAVATVTTTAKNLNTAGVTVNKTASLYKNTALKLSDLLTLDETVAGSVPGETVDQILDIAAGKVSDGAIVTFRKSTDPATAAAIAYADVIKTNGTYTYKVEIPKDGSSTNYILSGPIAGEGTLTVKTKSSGGGGGGGGSSSGGSTTTTTDVKKDISSSGSASVSTSELKNAKSVEAKSSQITVSLNQSAVNALDKTTGLVLKAEKKSGVTLNDAAKELLGSRPTFDVTATQNGKAVTDFGSGKITISIAYTAASGEDTGKLFLYYINDKGEAEKVSGSKYDGSLKAVTGQTSHLSLYAVGYDKDAADTTTPTTPASKGVFRDISSSDWFYTAVMNLAGKEILSGVQDEDAKGNPIGTYTFRPQNNVTRAEFVTMLAKLAGANLSTDSAKVFNDVSSGDWYAGAAAWANSTGVASGTGDGNFSPNANITRQDMAVMISKYLTNVAKTAPAAKNEKLTFTDGAQIAEYAASAVETMQTAGIISGTPNEDAKGNSIGTYQFRPFANATRAEAAAMLYGLIGTLQ